MNVTLKETFYPNGNTQSKVPGYHTEDNVFVPHGIGLEFYEDGKTLFRNTIWSNGLKDGTETQYYKAGGVGREQTWSMGELLDSNITHFKAPV